jgi:cell division protein FtsB
MAVVKKRRKSLILRIAVFAFIAYIAVTLTNLQLRISRDKATLSDVNAQYLGQQNKNEEIKRFLSESDSQYMESIARDKLGYAKPDERIFVNVSGN